MGQFSLCNRILLMITTGGQCGKIMNAVMGFVGQGYDMNESFEVRSVQKVQQGLEIPASQNI